MDGVGGKWGVGGTMDWSNAGKDITASVQVCDARVTGLPAKRVIREMAVVIVTWTQSGSSLSKDEWRQVALHGDTPTACPVTDRVSRSWHMCADTLVHQQHPLHATPLRIHFRCM